ncbi:MAG: hypothetical protein KVP17_000238 [Porospora cf. gigantea B]|uniref:uncharacterized protein n=1 Tax=Porospora cf. gigantea B TaxID=2853592 RepID=UPI003571D3A0|nr:MAG: hypothetical protein KVP17_000238 [Porospora cf. gigantea B]
MPPAELLSFLEAFWEIRLRAVARVWDLWVWESFFIREDSVVQATIPALNKLLLIRLLLCSSECLAHPEPELACLFEFLSPVAPFECDDWYPQVDSVPKKSRCTGTLTRFICHLSLYSPPFQPFDFDMVKVKTLSPSSCLSEESVTQCFLEHYLDLYSYVWFFESHSLIPLLLDRELRLRDREYQVRNRYLFSRSQLSLQWASWLDARTN